MILFQEDWGRYPDAIADDTTSNKSFLRYCKLLKAMGVKNHLFPLQLLNPSLKGVDPFSEQLTALQMRDITIECKRNIFYFLREVVRIPARGSSIAIPYIANRGNMALTWYFLNHIYVILIQSRQTGKSVSTDCIMVALLCCICQNSEISLITKDDGLRNNAIARIKDIISELPEYINQRSKKDLNNTENITIRSLNNVYKTYVSQASPKAAIKVGRGVTSPIFHIDEFAFINNIKITLPAALAAGVAARALAKSNNTPYGAIFTTTAGKKDDNDGKYAYQILSESAVHTESFYDCTNKEQLEDVIRKSSKGKILQVNCTLNHRQLGYTDEWHKQAMEESKSYGDDASRDFFNEWTSGSQTNPIPTTTLNAIREGQLNPTHTSIDPKYNYCTRWYIEEDEIESRMRNGFFILGGDTSDASGGDDTALVLIDAYTGEVVASGNYNETNLITFSEWLCDWFVKWPNFVAIIERRSSGAYILDYLLLLLPSKGIDPFKRLFNRVVQDSDENKDRFNEINTALGRRNKEVYITNKKLFGFATSGSGEFSRTELYSTTLQNAAKTIGPKIKDARTIDQILGLVVNNGRIDHQSGSHDDLVIAWLLASWLITKGKNLAFYGIESSKLLSQVKSLNTINYSDYLMQREQAQLREDIKNLTERLNRTNDNYISSNLEHQLRVKTRSLILDEGEVFSVDELINNIRSERRSNNNNYKAPSMGIYSYYRQ